MRMQDLHQKKPLILLGAGCHAKVVLSLLKQLNFSVLGVCDPQLAAQGIGEWRGLAVLGAGDSLLPHSHDSVWLANGIGQRVGDHTREKVFTHFKAQGYYFPVLKHPFTAVDDTVELAEGVQVMAGAVIQADARIGKNVILNTKSSIDHDCLIEDHVHIAPGAVLCGNVHVGRGAFIASGATLIQRIEVGENAVVAAGTSVVRNIKEKQMIMPAKVRHINRGECL